MTSTLDVKGWAILIVDDQPDNLEPLCKFLTVQGAIVHLAGNGRKALDLLARIRPTVILADLSMPVMDGMQLVREIKASPATRDIPIIAVTAHALASDRDRALEAGFDGYIAKPFRPSLFLRELQRVLAPEVTP